MKKFSSKCLIWTLVLFMIGLSLLLTAGLSGGFNQLKSEATKGVNTINVMGYEFPVSINFGKEAYKGSGKSVDIVIENSGATRFLDIEIGASDVEMLVYDGQDIKVEGTNVDGEIVCEIEGSKCKIEQKSNIKNFSLGNAAASSIKIYIPEGKVYEQISAEVGAGKFTVSDITAGTMEFEIGAGDVRMENAQCDKLDVECGAGNFIYNGKILDEADVEVAAGNLEMTMDKFENYNYEVSAAVGNVNLGGARQNAFGTDIEKKHDGATANIKVEVAVGNVDIK